MPGLPDDRSVTERLGLSRPSLPRHVWVDGEPGLLLEWDRRADGWWGRVVTSEGGQAVESWVRADRLRPS
ncbi:hypothetical protein CGZ93_17980 [Enemella dayhoffiae]|uniref:Uncharacterized protein n=1 Tax=Enemella dayhoffiae TaxID=2016507 RepID=A0A255GLF3_9ACTN|nr:hypothetical protein CGZ93_17980 [Enemella dayhoffiae]